MNNSGYLFRYGMIYLKKEMCKADLKYDTIRSIDEVVFESGKLL